MSNDWLIKNAELIDEGRRFHADLRVTARNLDVHRRHGKHGERTLGTPGGFSSRE